MKVEMEWASRWALASPQGALVRSSGSDAPCLPPLLSISLPPSFSPSHPLPFLPSCPLITSQFLQASSLLIPTRINLCQAPGHP